jgi:guanine deaminase
MDASSRRSYVEHSARDSADAAESFVTRLSGLLAGLEEHERFVYPVITPRFIPTCSNELLRALGKVAHNHIALCQSHMSESLDQVTLVRNDRGLDDIEIFEEVNGMSTFESH